MDGLTARKEYSQKNTTVSKAGEKNISATLLIYNGIDH